MGKTIIWREATQEEIAQGLDDANNKGMILVEIIETPDEEITPE
jgi:hypothetical protein